VAQERGAHTSTHHHTHTPTITHRHIYTHIYLSKIYIYIPHPSLPTSEQPPVVRKPEGRDVVVQAVHRSEADQALYIRNTYIIYVIIIYVCVEVLE
jgi:hypothetical protein